MNKDEKFPVSIAIVEDPEGRGYTASFREYEALVTQGDTEEEAIDNLFSLLNKIFKKYAKEHKMRIDNKDNTITVNAKIKSVNFE